MGEFRVRKTDDNFDNWTVADGDTFADSEKYIDRQGAVDDRCVPFNTEAEAQAALDLYLAKQGQNIKPTNPKDALAINKAPLSTLPTGPMYEVALAMLEGARKYGRHNYRVMGVSAEVYYNAVMGHITAWWEGEDIDPASGVHHLGKAMACLAVIRDGQMMENWTDDRPPKYPNGGELMRNNPIVKIILEKYPDCIESYTELNKDQKR